MKKVICIILTIACTASLAVEVFSYTYNLIHHVEKPAKISVDKVYKPVYPVGTFEYEQKRTI